MSTFVLDLSSASLGPARHCFDIALDRQAKGINKMPLVFSATPEC
jgi:hypothetical protein